MADERTPGRQPGEGQGGQGQNCPIEQEQQQQKRRIPAAGRNTWAAVPRV